MPNLVATRQSRSGLSTLGWLLAGHSSDGTGTVVGRNDDGGPGLSSRLSNLRLQAGDYTVGATTYGDRRTGTYNLRVQVAGSTAAIDCDGDLGTLAAGQYTRNGTITADNACPADHRGSSTNPHRARRHTFRLDAPAWVDIDLAKTTASSLDPYLVLTKSNSGTPTIVEQDNNDGPANAAQIRGRYLEAGNYTIEATTAAANGSTADGDYTLTVTVPIHGLAATNTAAVDEQTTLTFNYWPPNAQIAISAAASEELQPTVTATAAGTTHGTAAVTVTPQLVRVHDDIAVRVRTGNRTRSYGPITLAVQQPCNEYLGGLETERITRSGLITNDTECTSTRRLDEPGNPGTYYARRYAFTVDSPGWVTVNLEAQDPNTLDTHLILLRGHGGTGTVIDSDDNSGPSTNSRLTDIFLQKGNYTIETTTKKPGATGNYTLTVNATITGLQASYDATVGRELRIDFDLGNRQATATASHASFGLAAQRTGTTGTLLVVSDSTNARTVTLSFSKANASGSAAQRSASGAQGTEDAEDQSTEISFVSTCDKDQTPDLETGACVWNDVAIRKARKKDRYEVTKALHDGVFTVAHSVVNARTAECAMTATQLAALMLAIGIYEANPIGKFSPARSLMFVSRLDNDPKLYVENYRPTESVPGPGPKRAFWHPGVGYWQLDIWALELNHAERADVGLGGAKVAKYLNDAYCSGGEKKLKNSLIQNAWNGCIQKGKKNAKNEWIKDAATGLIVGEHVCFAAFEKLYLGGGLGDSTYKGIEGLWVTVSGRERLINKKGGVQDLQCRWGNRGTGFACWLYDTDNPEGYLDRWDPEGDGEPNDPAYRTVMVCPNGAKTCSKEEMVPKLVCPNNTETCADEDKIRVRYKFRSPLAAPFVSFTHGSKRFAVFPESFTGGTVTWFKHVPVGKEVREYEDETTWHEENFDINEDDTGDVLRVQDTTSLIPIGLESVHPWVDVAAPSFSTAMRRRYP